MNLLGPLKTGCVVELENTDEFTTMHKHEFMVDAHGNIMHYEEFENFDHKKIASKNVAQITGVTGDVIYKRNGVDVNGTV